ncbi:MAG: hypothetical protein DMH00_02315, partial [Acidobacteria bacterium]
MLRAILTLLAVLLTAVPEPSPGPSGSPAADAILALMHRAAAQRRHGDYAGAALSYRQVLRRAPGLYEAHLFLADALSRRRLRSEAEAEFSIARRLRPTDPLPYAGLADLQSAAFRFDAALAVLAEGGAAVPPEKAERLEVARGATLRQSGDPAGAAQLLAEAAQRFPSSARVQQELGRSLLALGQVGPAVTAFTAAHERAPETAALALEMKEAGDLSDRLRGAEQAARAPGAGVEGLAALARLRCQARQFPQCAEAATAALKKNRARSDLLLLRALALEQGARPSDAEADLRRIPAKAPEHLLALYHLAYLQRLKADDQAEEKIWAEATQTHAGDPTARLMRVLCWKRLGELESRLESLRRDNAGKKSAAPDRVLEAIALEELGRAEAAGRTYAELFRSDPGDPEIAARLSGILIRSPEQLGKWLEEERAAKLTEGKPGSPERELLLAHLLETAGHPAAALEELRGAALAFPDRGDVALALSVLLDKGNSDGKEAAAWREKVARLDPRSPWPPLWKGLALLKAGDGRGAVVEAQRALELAPDRVEAWQLAGSARRVAGDPAGAVKDLNRALLLDPSDFLGAARFQLALTHAGTGDYLAARQALEGDLPPFSELIYRLAWSFVDRNFLDRTFRGQDWQKLRDRFTDPHAAPARAYAEVAALLDSLNDPYTRLRGTEETVEIYLRPRSSRLETDRSGAPLPDSGTVITGDLGEDIGYLRLTNFSDPSAREAIRKALEKMALEEGLVLDLRGNAGGLVSEADAIAGMLLEPGETLGIQRSATGEAIQKVPQTRPVLGRKPMVILTDRRTGSAAEKLAAGLQGSGRATVLGENTFG